jgi:hypothetical protein
MIPLGDDRRRSTGIRFKQRKLRPDNQLPEVTIKTDQVLTEVERRGEAMHPVRHFL